MEGEIVNRRQALKSAAAGLGALLLPSWFITPARRRIDLTVFCAKRDFPRYSMTQPFLQGDFTYATDARIAVRVAPLAGDLRENETRLPPAAGLPWDHDRLRGWAAPGKPLMATDSDCPECCGAGFIGVLRPCDNAACDEGRDYSGPPYPHRQEDFTCRRCLGHEEFSDRLCGTCKGKGTGTFPGLVRIGSRYVDCAALRRVLTVGEVELAVSATPIKVSGKLVEESPVCFRFDGGVGMLMPVEHKSALMRLRLEK
jgi:hypothetical protein